MDFMEINFKKFNFSAMILIQAIELLDPPTITNLICMAAPQKVGNVYTNNFHFLKTYCLFLLLLNKILSPQVLQYNGKI